MKPVFSSLLGGDSSPKAKGIAFLMASIVAGAVAAVLLCPMESTRIRIVTDKDYAGKGLLTGLPKLIKEEGLFSTFSGIWAMLAKQVNQSRPRALVSLYIHIFLFVTKPICSICPIGSIHLWKASVV